MKEYYQVEGTENVLDLKKFRTLKECQRLFGGYKNRLVAMNKEQVSEEKGRLKEEVQRYPNHLLTKVKRHIFENTTNIKV